MKNNLKSKRQSLNLTQKQVASSLNIAESAYQRYERGDVTPTVYFAIKLAKVLNTTVEELFPLEKE